MERRKKAAEENVTSGRVEITRVNTDTLIDQLLKSTNLEATEDTTGCKFFIYFIYTISYLENLNLSVLLEFLLAIKRTYF